MAVNEFEPDDIFGDLNRKFANVSLERNDVEDIYREILLSDVSNVENTPILLSIKISKRNRFFFCCSCTSLEIPWNIQQIIMLVTLP